MEVVLDPSQYTGVEHAVTVGAYDGVHVGHQAVIRATQQEADRLGIRSAVVTFEPHPALVLRPDLAPKLLTDLDQKLGLLEALGVDTTVVVPFDQQQATQSAETFVERVIVGCLSARSVIVGYDFHFGVEREGNVDFLRSIGERLGFTTDGMQLMPRPDGKTEPVSSTAIRRALAGGEVKTAARLLGRNYELRGVVIEGDRRGRTIGFPTANVAIPHEIALPADAVYAAWYVGPDGVRWPTAVNIGKRPTFYLDAEHSLVEAHLIGFDGDLYGQPARVQMVELIRSEQRFDGLDALVEQLERDVRRATGILERAR